MRAPRLGIGCVLAAAVALLAGVGACGGPRPSEPAADVASGDAHAGPARRDGRLVIDDAFVPVMPLVIHEARMDLFVACRHAVDEDKTAGREAPLCYDATRRARSAVRVIRVEHRPGATVDAMRILGDAHEGAHFLVERTGTVFQILDLGYAARREGASRGDELRILAMGGKEPRGAEAAVRPLLEELAALYPAARVDEVDAPGVAATPAPGSPAAAGSPATGAPAGAPDGSP